MSTAPTIGMVTPWGPANFIEHVAEGIWFVSTASHGGYLLSEERATEVPQHLREWADGWATRNGVTPKGQWYEEDCCAAVIPVTFGESDPEVFGESADFARQMLAKYGPTN